MIIVGRRGDPARFSFSPGWRGPRDRRLVQSRPIPLFSDGRLSEEETHRSFYMDCTASQTPVQLVKWIGLLQGC